MGIRVLVAGAAGRMGREVVRAVLGDPDTELVAAIDVVEAGKDAGTLAVGRETGVAVQTDLSAAIAKAKPEVVVDFTRAEAAHRNALTALAAGVSPVIGTTGMTPAQIAEIGAAAERAGVGAVVAPNFAIGAVLMMQFAAQAVKYLPDVEIIELHHEKKVDAPSGTAVKTAEMIVAARSGRGTPRPEEEIKHAGARGADFDGVRIHSVRLPGYVAHQEVILGGPGQTLAIRHDTTERGPCFMPGVLLAVKAVRSHRGLVYGLEHLL